MSVFMFFFVMRLLGKVRWVSLNVVSKHFFKVIPINAFVQEPDLLFDSDGESPFPLYWQSNPIKFKFFDERLLSPEERLDASIFARFLASLDAKTILTLPDERDHHQDLDGKYCYILF